MVTLKSALCTMERLLLPGFLFCFEFIFLVLFGLLVRYDERGSPDVELAKARQLAEAGDQTDFVRELASTLSTTKTYPCEPLIHLQLGELQRCSSYMVFGELSIQCSQWPP